MTHKGPANVKRLPKNVCSKLLAPGLEQMRSAGMRRLVPFYTDLAPKLAKEPPVWDYALKPVP